MNRPEDGVTGGLHEGSGLYPWYDSWWLGCYVRAQAIIQAHRPDALAAFIDAFRVFRTQPDFEVRVFERLFDEATLGDIRRVTSSLRPADLNLDEARSHGRFVVRDQPLFNQLQECIVPLVSEAVGEPVEASYNFLGLYGSRGICPPHMDAPDAKWTVDLCVDQSAPWPIYFSQVCPWPESDGPTPEDEDWVNRVKQAPSLRFTPYTLQPGEAVLFSGSSQWHYRDAIPAAAGRSFSTCLFFHFIPRGTAELSEPKAWPRLFGIAELSGIL